MTIRTASVKTSRTIKTLRISGKNRKANTLIDWNTSSFVNQYKHISYSFATLIKHFPFTLERDVFIFDLMDLNYGMNSMKDSSVVLLNNLKKN